MEVSLLQMFEIGEEKDKYFAVVEYDNCLRNMILHCFNLKEMREFLNTSGIRSDFTIKDGMLCCHPMTRSVSTDAKSLKFFQESSGEVLNFEDGGLYKLLDMGIQNDFIIVDTDKSAVHGCEFVGKFRDIKFSRSTMSVYLPLCVGGEMYNKMIVTLEGSILKFHPFTFATPTNFMSISGCTRLNSTITINGVEYQLWETNILNLYDSVLTIGSIVNQAAYDSEVYAETLKFIGDFKQSILTCETESAKWVGSSKSYATFLGVYLSSSYKPATANQRHTIINEILQLFAEGKTVEYVEAILREKLSAAGYRSGTIYAACVLAYLAQPSKDMSFMLEKVLKAEHNFKCLKLYKDMYLYRVRTGSFLQHVRIAPITSPVLFGGRTTEFTTIKENFPEG